MKNLNIISILNVSVFARFVVSSFWWLIVVLGKEIPVTSLKIICVITDLGQIIKIQSY